MPFGKKRYSHRFTLHSQDEEPSARDDGKRINISKPDRSRYPRLLDLLPVFIVVALLLVFAMLFLRFIK